MKIFPKGEKQGSKLTIKQQERINQYLWCMFGIYLTMGIGGFVFIITTIHNNYLIMKIVFLIFYLVITCIGLGAWKDSKIEVGRVFINTRALQQKLKSISCVSWVFCCVFWPCSFLLLLFYRLHTLCIFKSLQMAGILMAMSSPFAFLNIVYFRIAKTIEVLIQNEGKSRKKRTSYKKALDICFEDLQNNEDYEGI